MFKRLLLLLLTLGMPDLRSNNAMPCQAFQISQVFVVIVKLIIVDC